jgi:hypothetical protein
MHYRIRLPGGTLKIKTRQYLRTREIEGRVPMKRLGGLYFIWWPEAAEAQRQR